MDPTIFSSVSGFSEMVSNSKQQNHLEDEFCDFYLNDSYWEENQNAVSEHGNEEEDGDADDEPDFESSQLHQLVHTQPIHLINCQMLSDYTLTGGESCEDAASSRSSILASFEDIDVVSEDALNFFDGGSMTTEANTAATSATSAHFKYNPLDITPEEWNLWKQQFLISNGCENSAAFVDASETNIDAIGTAPLKNTEGMDWDIPRSVPFEYTNEGHLLDFSKYINHQEELEVSPLHLQQPNQCHNGDSSGRNYSYHLTTDISSTRRCPTEAESFFVKTLSSKLSRYTDYFGAASRDQEYYDKVRFQEISYKFSKTYF